MAGSSGRYTHGHHAAVVAQHARRTAKRDAAYLLPYLRPGMRLLDIGCGPGTITTGLGRAVSPGEVVGIDPAPEAIASARAHLATTALANVRFEEASVYALPYADGSFDATHAHQVWQHLDRPVEAARHVLRILRPGGMFGVRDADYATMVSWPRSAEIDRWLEVYHAVAAANGADADAGRRLPSWLREAGFSDVEVGASVVLLTGREAVLNWGDSWAERVTRSSLAEQAVEYGIASRDELAAIAAGWRRWARSADAFFMYVNVECVAVRPAEA